MVKESPRVERMQVMCTKEMRQLIERNAAALGLSTSSYIELMLGKAMSSTPSQTFYNSEEI